MIIQPSQAPTCCEYCNPCSDRFKKYSFCKLSCCEKIKIIGATFFGALCGLGVGGLAVFRYCLRKKEHARKIKPYVLAKVVPKSPHRIDHETKVPDAPRARDRPDIAIAIESPKE